MKPENAYFPVNSCFKAIKSFKIQFKKKVKKSLLKK